MKTCFAVMLLTALYSVVTLADDEPRSVKLSKADAALQAAAQDDALDDSEHADLVRRYQHLVDEYPDWYEGYSGLATVAVMADDCEVAVEQANLANERRPNAIAYYTLTLCYTREGRYEDAITAADSTIQHNIDLTRNTEFMIHSAFAFTEVGKYEVARNLLGMILEAKPEVKENEKFLRTGQNLASRMREAGLID